MGAAKFKLDMENNKPDQPMQIPILLFVLLGKQTPLPPQTNPNPCQEEKRVFRLLGTKFGGLASNKEPPLGTGLRLPYKGKLEPCPQGGRSNENARNRIPHLEVERRVFPPAQNA